MKNKKIIIAIILGVGAVISLIYGITATPKGKVRAPAKPETIQGATDTQPTEKITPTKRRASKTEFTSWGRNPFVQKGAPGTRAGKLTLDGIMWHEEKPKAMINNNIVGKGDKVGGYTVVDIKRNKVILDDGTEKIGLNLEE